MQRILKEPLLHFLVLGGILFAIFAWVDDEDPFGIGEEEEKKIVVSAGRIEQLASIYTKTWQRPPTKRELEGLVEDFVLEEIYYRKAVAMGIDRNDTVIRRRLRQKLEFLTDDAMALIEPTEKDLTDYLSANSDKFREDPVYTFRQIYINPEKHGENLQAHVEAQLAALKEGKEVFGESGLIPADFQNSPRRVVDGTFGLGFSEQLEKLELGEWLGPFRSGLGVHLLKMESREEGAVPEFAKIRPLVQREWENQRRNDGRAQFNKKLRSQFEIEIDWSELEGEGKTP